MDTVIVVSFDDESAFALDGEVILGIDASARRIGLGLAGVIRIRVRFSSRSRVSKRVGRAVFRDDKRLVRFLHVNRGIGRVGKRQSLHVQINGCVRLWRRHENLSIVTAVRSAKIVFATASNLDGTARDRDAVSAIGNRCATSRISNNRTIRRGIVVNLFNLVRGTACRRRQCAARRSGRGDTVAACRSIPSATCGSNSSATCRDSLRTANRRILSAAGRYVWRTCRLVGRTICRSISRYFHRRNAIRNLIVKLVHR